MPIVFICSVPFGGGERLARLLAGKLDYSFLGREDVVARANECGIPVGKLEVAMVRRPSVQERMATLKDRYLAVATATICEKAARGSLVYYGRAGHLLLPGVSHVVRVRVIPEPDQRLENAMIRTKLPREKAETFLQEIDSDVRSWVRFVHNVDMDDPRKYDFMVNLEKVSIENAAAALCGIAEMPDFRTTPASERIMEDRLLQSRARIKLALDERTAGSSLTVHSSDGEVTITYMPRQSRVAPEIPKVLEDLPGCRAVRCTMASTNILWIQEEFRPEAEALRQMMELARRWGAAVELLRFRPEGASVESVRTEEPVTAAVAPRAATGWIEDDVVETTSPADRGFHDTLEALIHDHSSGGGQTVGGTRESLVAALSRSVHYSLVVVGDTFLKKPQAARLRLTRELCSFLRDEIKAPVIGLPELGAKLRFGSAQWVRLGIGVASMVLLYWLLFAHQARVLDALGGSFHALHPYASVLIVAVLAPLAAGLNAMVAGLVLRILKLD